MSVPKERCLSPHTFGVYPNHQKLPSSLCCFRIMQLRTGVQWLAYGEMVWITSQLSYWAAQAVTNSFSQATIILGFLFTFSQIGKKLDVKNFLKTSSYAFDEKNSSLFSEALLVKTLKAIRRFIPQSSTA
ncbi:unnamed protein product [Heligmosomoides polygyrus]|uniref:7TM_GPCR_Srx domain-containing protein n=1 Tax=Heligmosomoides polygyrus TaxID=6339 RepID=A0A183GUV2_HELPZ|nr:unnamed protein product [Heligmosomoides polygyrus]